MNENKLKALAAKLTKDLKTETDLNQFFRMLTKLTLTFFLRSQFVDCCSQYHPTLPLTVTSGNLAK
ncbi:hypothetical protein CU788_15475 [Salmonella enterica]|nr:hypothetical protein [Salmonella enterica]EGW2852182.1 hypothetical protein [Salmonella enterica]